MNKRPDIQGGSIVFPDIKEILEKRNTYKE